MESANLARRIELLCRRLADGGVDDLIDRDGAVAAPVSRVLAAVRAGAPDEEQVGRDLDEVDAAALDSGVAGLTTIRRAYQAPPLPEPGHRLAHVLLCPLGACSRREIEYAADPLAEECPVARRPLNRVRLDL